MHTYKIKFKKNAHFSKGKVLASMGIREWE